MKAPPEQKLVEQAQQGDRAAMGDLLMLYRDRLYNTIYRMVGDADDAAELCQDTFVKIISNIRGYDGRSQIYTWMTRIAMNLAISHLRKRKVRKHASLDKPIGQAGEAEAGRATTIGQQLSDDGNPQPGQCVEEAEMMDHLLAAMDRLDDEFRSVLVLRDINEMDYRQIAEVLGTPIGTVKSRLFRARLSLRRELSRQYSELAEKEKASASPTEKQPQQAD